MVCLGTQILLGPFLNTLTQLHFIEMRVMAVKPVYSGDLRFLKKVSNITR